MSVFKIQRLDLNLQTTHVRKTLDGAKWVQRTGCQEFCSGLEPSRMGGKKKKKKDSCVIYQTAILIHPETKPDA